MSKVRLLVYDLSQGMAKIMSMGLVGKQIDGIWHTAVVVHSKEYCFGQGIEVMLPGHTRYGTPVDEIDMGLTEIPLDIFDEYIDTMRSVWTADKYHLLDNNCNSFSNEVCMFLIGKGIPAHITSLPAEFVNTPFGQSILPMIEAQFGASSYTPTASQRQLSHQPANQAQSFASNSHKHAKLTLSFLQSIAISSQIIHYKTSSNLDSIAKKLVSYIEEPSISRLGPILVWLATECHERMAPFLEEWLEVFGISRTN